VRHQVEISKPKPKRAEVVALNITGASDQLLHRTEGRCTRPKPTQLRGQMLPQPPSARESNAERRRRSAFARHADVQAILFDGVLAKRPTRRVWARSSAFRR
jgi:hypothetical protein